MIILNNIIYILIIMFKIIEQIKPGYLDALKNRDLEKLESYIKKLVEYYKETPEKNRKEFGAEILEILNMENSRGETAVMIDVKSGTEGKIEETIYSFSLESINFGMLEKLIDGLVEGYKATKSTIYSNRKEYGIESLKLFNMENSQGQNAVMLAAKHGKAALLEMWYYISDDLTHDISDEEGKAGIYSQRSASYVAQDNNGHNALTLAVMSGNLECLKFLLSPETAAALNQKDKDGKIALRHAIEGEKDDLVNEFLEIVKNTFDRVNQYNPSNQVKLEIDDNMSNFINNIENENMLSLIKTFISESKEHISRISSQSLKRKSTEQGNGTLEKKRKEETTVKTILQEIQKVLDGFEKMKDKIGPTRLVKLKKWMDDKLAKYTTELTEDHKNEVYQKLEELEGKLKEIGQLRLTKLLNEAEKEGLTTNQKGTIINNIKKIISEADIDLSEDQMHLIPSSIMSEVVEIINTKEKAATI